MLYQTASCIHSRVYTLVKKLKLLYDTKRLNAAQARRWEEVAEFVCPSEHCYAAPH